VSSKLAANIKRKLILFIPETGNGGIVINEKIGNISAVTLSFGRKNYQALLIKSQGMFKGLFLIIIIKHSFIQVSRPDCMSIQVFNPMCLY